MTYEVNIHKIFCVHLTFCTVTFRYLIAKGDCACDCVRCTQGVCLILVVLFSIYTEIETLFSFISIIKMITVCDRRYLEKPIHIVCWACMSLIQCGKVLLLALGHSSMRQTKIPQLSRNTLNTNLMHGHRDSSVSPCSLPKINEHRNFYILSYCEQTRLKGIIYCT